MKAAVDNDILYKGACYGLLPQFIGVIPADVKDVGILGAAQYVVGRKLSKAKLNGDAKRAVEIFQELLGQAMILEPREDEEKFAAELEYAAQRANLNLDAGESLLCAIVMVRAWSWLVTGDKRAVVGMEKVLAGRDEIGMLAGKVLCLEHILLRLIGSESTSSVRDAVCEEPDIDRALTNCFSCYSPEVGRDSWAVGLDSYIAALRAVAPTVLVAQL